MCKSVHRLSCADPLKHTELKAYPMQRRDWLKTSVLAVGGVAVGSHAWAVANAQAYMPQRLIVVMLRGAVDGLSVVVPYADSNYYVARSSIALGRPGTSNGVLDLDGSFGLHPALSPLIPFWQSGKLSFVHAAGSPDPTRSHFDAQDYMESATPGRKATPDGWMNRLVGVLPGDGDSNPMRAVSIGATLPRIYAGRHTVSNIPSGPAASKQTPIDHPIIGAAFSKLYNNDDQVSKAFHASIQARQEVMSSLEGGSLESEMAAANNGAPLPNGFPDDANRLARLMRNDARIQLAFLNIGGWDTHANQGSSTGQLANRLQPLGQGLAALGKGLGEVFDNTVIVVMSEFGRTVHQNGNGGTDHGHGNVMWVMGGKVAGGAVKGQWPGLSSSALYEGRDLAVTTDFRQVLIEVMARHMLLKDHQLTDVFPHFAGVSEQSLGLIRG